MKWLHIKNQLLWWVVRVMKYGKKCSQFLQFFSDFLYLFYWMYFYYTWLNFYDFFTHLIELIFDFHSELDWAYNNCDWIKNWPVKIADWSFDTPAKLKFSTFFHAIVSRLENSEEALRLLFDWIVNCVMNVGSVASSSVSNKSEKEIFHSLSSVLLILSSLSCRVEKISDSCGVAQ